MAAHMRMPFGKYQGVLIADLPDDYLSWLFTKLELREPLRTKVGTEYHARFSRRTSTATPPLPEVITMAEELVSAGYRKLAHRHHPDHGGDHAAMVLVNNAADYLRTRLRST